MVMQYMPEGNLRHYLSKNNKELTLKDKINQLVNISRGLKDIHQKNLVHRDFHSGNILKGIEKTSCLITDLGLCKPVDEAKQEKKVFGVLPYVAPEVLRSQPYTQKADIYSFGIVAYEVLTGINYFNELREKVSTDLMDLGLQVCQSLRPQFNLKIPQLLEVLVKRCWDKDPAKRPTANELEKTLRNWENNTEFTQQLQEAEEYNKNLPDEVKYPKYKELGDHHSKYLPTKEITQLLQNSQEITASNPLSQVIDYSSSLAMDFTNLNLEENQQNQEQQAQILQPTNLPYGTPGSSK